MSNETSGLFGTEHKAFSQLVASPDFLDLLVSIDTDMPQHFQKILLKPPEIAPVYILRTATGLDVIKRIWFFSPKNKIDIFFYHFKIAVFLYYSPLNLRQMKLRRLQYRND